MALKIHNVHTNITGRAADIRFADEQSFLTHIHPVLEKLLQSLPDPRSHKALIGRWVVELFTNDPHLHEFFCRNWKTADPADRPVVRCYALTGVPDEATLKALRGIRDEAGLKANLEQCLKELSNPKYRGLQNDESLKNIERLAPEERLRTALRRPFAIYCSPLKTFVTVNSNYYGQLKSKSSLGPLEEFLIEKGKLNADGTLENPEEIWVSMHAGSVETVNRHGEKKGVVLIAPTGTGKSTQGYGLVEARRENKLHSDDWVFVNPATREVLISENQFYMRTNIAEIFPHLIPLLVNEPLENVALTEPTIRLIEQFGSAEELAKAIREGRVSSTDYERLVQEMIKTSSARSLIDPRIMVGAKKFTEKTTLNFILLLKRDYMDKMVCRVLSPEELIRIMTSRHNVFNYLYGKTDPDGYGIPAEPTTEIYYNPYLCRVEADGEKGEFGELDRLRVAAYRQIASHPKVTPGWVNTRLRAPQTQFCLRKFLEGDADRIEVVKGFEAEEDTLRLMKLVKKEKEPIPERRMIDLVGLYSSEGVEVELVSFSKDNVVREYVAFAKTGLGEKQVVSYSEGNLKSFYEHNRHVGARQLFQR